VITYTITYTNDSSGSLSSIVINDATPAYTLFQSAARGTIADGCHRLFGDDATRSRSIGHDSVDAHREHELGTDRNRHLQRQIGLALLVAPRADITRRWSAGAIASCSPPVELDVWVRRGAVTLLLKKHEVHQNRAGWLV
jgi:hypothetical protein